MTTELTNKEIEVIEALVDAWNCFLELPKQHFDDQTEFRHAIHQLQHLILARPTRRAYVEKFPDMPKQ